MRIVVLILAATIAGCTSPPPPSSGVLPELAGRTAGEPQRCIARRQAGGLYIAGPHAIAVSDGSTLWINYVPGCVMRKSSDILVIEPVGPQYCSGDFVRTRDNISFLPGPGCRLNDFVPYTKP